MKALCDKCNNLAVWNYVPGKGDAYYCEDHVPRGRSCNIDPDSGEEDRDKEGRLVPCCEYDYNEKGFRIEL